MLDRTRLTALLLLLITTFVGTRAQSDTVPDDTGIPYVIFAEDANRAAIEVDSLFYLNALSIVFPANRTIVADDNPALLNFIKYARPLLSDERLQRAHVRIRSAASPEGTLYLNRQLSRGRRDALLQIFQQYGVNPASVQIDVVDEEYELLGFFMRQKGDPDAALVTQMINQYKDAPLLLKHNLKKQDHGRLWRRILSEYFPRLRASRFMIILPETHKAEFLTLQTPEIKALSIDPLPMKMPEGALKMPDSIHIDIPVLNVPAPVVQQKRLPRREMLSVKTNLLEWAAWVPQYGMCPMPNVEVEFYPRHGHWTLGGNFDCPWWVGNTTNHKYFELRNYTLYTRYYLRNSNRSYSDASHTTPNGKAAFQGFYLSAYAHAFLYQLGFSATKGWIGEGLGGGLGLGYVVPISRSGHWRLDFGLQVGMFYTPYDPFVWGKPTYHGGTIDGLYYYDTPLYRDNFVKRQHRYTWLGPTRVGISISYDLLYRKDRNKGISFRQKGGRR